MTDDIEDKVKVTFGENPKDVGHCIAVTFIIERNGKKLKGRIVRRREFSNGLIAKETCVKDEDVLSKQYNASAGTIYFDAEVPLTDHFLEQQIRDIVRAQG